ncbi:MAG: GFA family protein [Pseudomonadota bacterium]
MSISGGCLCGQARYEVAAQPLLTGVCHCKNCQRQAGSAFSILIGVPKPAVRLEGHLKTYVDTADSGRPVHRQFCETCGSPVFTQVPDQPDMTYIKAGTLDDTSSLQPQIHFWCDSAQPWVDIDSDVQKFPKNP